MLLPSLDDNPSKVRNSNEKATTFVHRFGAYLKLHACLIAAASAKAETLIEVLLELAQHDPKHREVTKHISRMGSLVLYEEVRWLRCYRRRLDSRFSLCYRILQSMLSAFIESLHALRKEKLVESGRKVIDWCACAYPDLQPWQVKKECMVPDGSKSQESCVDLYYAYLTDLLHPIDGNDTAKKEAYLVNVSCTTRIRWLRKSLYTHAIFNYLQDWCRLSIDFLRKTDNQDNKAKDYKMHFMAVASRASSTHVMYKRDLVALLELSMQINQTELALDLGTFQHVCVQCV